jgi:hypothetical protein
MTTEPAAVQIGAALAALLLVNNHPHLPAPVIRFQRFSGEDGAVARGVQLSLHDNLSEFEQWRQALDIDPDTVEHAESVGTGWLHVTSSYADAPVELVGYYDLPDDETDRL